MNDGSTQTFVAKDKHHKCGECRYYPESQPTRCYCPMRNTDVGAKQQACVLGKRR